MSDAYGAKRPLVSVVVPAHNEEAVIAGTLQRLLSGAAPGEFDIVVVANGCVDRTADVARQSGVRVLETPVPGKANALRLGDDACRTFPRAYLDADVELTARSVRALAAACARPGVLACAPVPRLDLHTVGPITRRVHKVHEGLVAPARALAGVGCYVLTKEGHARAFPMPDDLISDDGWIHATFTPKERAVVTEAQTLIKPARTVVAYLNRRVRVRRGNLQLAVLGRPNPAGRLRLRSLAGLLRQRQVTPLDAGCYLAVLSLDRALTRIRRNGGGSWGSDASTRSPAPGVR